MAVVIGTNGNDILNGTVGNDTVKGLKGNDELNGLDGDDILDGGDGNDTLDSGIGDDVLLGGIGLDTLVGGIGNNRLDGGSGIDDLRGGDGDDTYVVDNIADLITDTAGTDLVESKVAFILGAALENLTLTGGGSVSGTGNGLANTLIGNTGSNKLFGLGDNDYLDGGSGSDSLAGGTGDDTYIVESKNDKVFENLGEGDDTVQCNTDFTLPDNVETLLLGFLIFNKPLIGTGNALDNLIVGNTGNNTLNGMLGADVLIGDAGDDTFIVDDAAETVLDASGLDIIHSSINWDLNDSTGVENLLLIGAAAINGTGDAGVNTITGNAAANILDGQDGDDTLNGMGGADAMIGGKGEDVFIVDNAADTITEVAGEGVADHAQASASFDMGANAAEVELLTLTGKLAINGTGNGSDNIITGNGGANTLNGGAGDDTLTGGGGNDVLNGDADNDTLDGGLGADTMRGGAGDDVYILNAATGKTIVELAGEGADEVQSTVTHTLAAEVDNLVLLGGASLNGAGNAGVNTITGNAGVNTLNGMGGADSLIGGGGLDFFVVDDAGDEVTGAGTVLSSVSWNLGVNTTGVDNLTLTGLAAIDGTGNANANTITGNVALNNLMGGAGDDVLFADALDILDGGADSDTAAVAFTAAVTNPNWTSIENITLLGTGAFNATGDGGNNTLTGNRGKNTLDGGLGDDAFGITSGDVIIDAGGTDTVLAGFTYTLIAGMENLTLTGTGKINGFGTAGANTITGNSGNNTLDGLGGADVLIGALGDDVFIVNNAGITVTENGAEGEDTIRTNMTYALDPNVENLVLTGLLNIDGTGNGDNNSLTGNDGNNILDGGAGADVMAGGRGNDTFLVDDVGDKTSDSSGIDTAIATDVSHAIGSGVDNLTLISVINMDIDGTGNNLANIITGTDGANRLNGAGGNDTLVGGLGDDTYIVNSTSDVVFENINEGTDTVEASCTFTLPHDVEILEITSALAAHGTGNALDNTITGGSGLNILRGGDGNDTLEGMAGDDVMHGDLGDDVLISQGKDTMFGGDGADLFTFLNATAFDDMIDIIKDYNPLQGDAVDISEILDLAGFVTGVDDLDDYAVLLNNRYVAVDTSGMAGANGWTIIAQCEALPPNTLFVVIVP